ncbi:hypothetical protein L596_008155 [Steinernema carpocapsae]|uniref:Uncharacterized protein n=1 Tax=Steinernema carpocapsae TaxID=34508 RepID=A0A4U5PCM6_STECR|nr:hypothetical protein L596_008155 [Steinernema carpocapsae]
MGSRMRMWTPMRSGIVEHHGLRVQIAVVEEDESAVGLEEDDEGVLAGEEAHRIREEAIVEDKVEPNAEKRDIGNAKLD